MPGSAFSFTLAPLHALQLLIFNSKVIHGPGGKLRGHVQTKRGKVTQQLLAFIKVSSILFSSLCWERDASSFVCSGC